MATLNYLFPALNIGRPDNWTGTMIKIFSVKDTLLSKGFEDIEEAEIEETLINKEANIGFDKAANGTFTWEFVELINDKEFRIQLKKMIYEGILPLRADVQKYFIEATSANQLRFTKTIEFLIALLCIKELKALSASFGVKIKNSPHGGDYDCIAIFQNSIFHFEVKSGNATNIKNDTIIAFLERHNFLTPTASILFLDYEGGTNKLDDLVRQFKNQLIGKRRIDCVRKISHRNKKFYAVGNDVLIVDIHSDGNILSNLRLAMQYIHRYNAYLKWMTLDLVTPDLFGYESIVL